MAHVVELFFLFRCWPLYWSYEKLHRGNNAAFAMLNRALIRAGYTCIVCVLGAILLCFIAHFNSIYLFNK